MCALAWMRGDSGGLPLDGVAIKPHTNTLDILRRCNDRGNRNRLDRPGCVHFDACLDDRLAGVTV